MTSAAKHLRGRPHLTAEQSLARKGYRNISVDGDIVKLLNTAADTLQATLGFRPTISQTLRHLLNRLEKESR